MPAKGWGKDTETLNAVQDCVVRRLTTDESLVFLKSKGHEMSESKLRRIKKYIRESTDDRLNYIAYHEYSASYLDAIDTIKSVNARLWEISKENKDTKLELSALAQIPTNIKLLEELYDSNPIVASLSNKLVGADDVS
jgi:hypothetical protein